MCMINASQTYETNTVTPLIVTDASLTPDLYTSRVSSISIRSTVSFAILFQEPENSLNHSVTADASFYGPMDTGTGVVFLWGKLELHPSTRTLPPPPPTMLSTT